MRSLVLSETGRPKPFSTDPNRADYACPAYREMQPRWELVDDVRAGPMRIQAKKESYLPRFEAETDKDWDARVKMTFSSEAYDRTIVEHTGLIFSQPLKLAADVPPEIVDLAEDIDGEGNHLDVFAQETLDWALHHGHSVLLTDYPKTDAVRNREDERVGHVRPYVTLYHADDVLAWDEVVVGKRKVIVRIMLRETSTEPDGAFGTKSCEVLREFRQEVFRDPKTDRPVALGRITWRTFTRTTADAAPTLQDSGDVVGPAQIPVRVVYGGQKLGTLFTKPHLYGLALTTVEEAQVKSDYAAVMHKCNVPTPIFIGRQRPAPGQKDEIKMGQGIDLPVGGDAKMLEPAGTAIGATRTRLEDLKATGQRQGATSADGISAQQLSATEAAIVAKSRNAKLLKAARSLKDAFEGVAEDIAAFLKLPTGGSIEQNTNFTGQTIDPAYLNVLVQAYREHAIPLEALMHALQHGTLPDDFSAENEALNLIADRASAEDAARMQADATGAASADQQQHQEVHV